MKIKCPKCEKILNIDLRTKPLKGKRTIQSFCEKTGKLVKIPIKKEVNNVKI
jgi:hypothetical protein